MRTSEVYLSDMYDNPPSNLLSDIHFYHPSHFEIDKLFYCPLSLET